ncbi:HAD-IIIA family hydrolase [Candidatus Woesearchaeota archaeon]|nr:HAD-IIIA family hydrolase [Candidatus Woesearchaeota archaeon]
MSNDRDTLDSTMKYFVTGGAGFIGSHVVDRLLKIGRVTVFDNFSSGKREFLRHHQGNVDLHIIEGDLLDLKKLTDCMKGHDVVIHLSANSDIRKSETQTDLDLQQGTIATYHVLEAMRKNGITVLVFSSTSAVYGEESKKQIEKEKRDVKSVVQDALLSETYAPLLPISHYGASKLAGEGMISAFCHLYGMKALIFRFANVVGKRGTHGVIYDFIQKVKRTPERLEILGDGSQQKSYILAEDVADAIIYVLNKYQTSAYPIMTDQNRGHDKPHWTTEIFNLATATSITVREITSLFAEEYKRRTGEKLELVYTGGDRGWKGDVPKVLLDPTKIESLGWKASCTSQEAVKQAIHDLFDEQWSAEESAQNILGMQTNNNSNNKRDNDNKIDNDDGKTAVQAVAQAAILTGGEGSRLGSLTRDVPKPLISVGGKPILEHLLLLLQRYGIKEVILCSGRLAGKIIEVVGDGKLFGVQIQHSIEPFPLGSGGPIVHARDLLHDDVIVMNGDVFIDMDLRALLRFHQQRNALATLVVHPSDHPEDSDVILLDDGEQVKELIHKPGRDVGSRITNAGLCVINRTALDHFPNEQKLNLELDIITSLISSGRVYAYNTERYDPGAYLKDMGTPERLQQVEKYYETKQQEGRQTKYAPQYTQIAQMPESAQISTPKCTNISTQIIEGKPVLYEPSLQSEQSARPEQDAWILDRDGVINEQIEFITATSQFHLLPGAAEAIRILNQQHIPVVIATNQPVIARGLCTEQDVENIHNYLRQELAKYGARVDAIYYCPHHPETHHPEANNPIYRRPCDCRKPNIGMLQQAAHDLQISLKKSTMVGDSTRDILAGKNAGCTTILVKTGNAGKDKQYSIEPDYVEESLYHAVVHHVFKQNQEEKPSHLVEVRQ